MAVASLALPFVPVHLRLRRGPRLPSSAANGNSGATQPDPPAAAAADDPASTPAPPTAALRIKSKLRSRNQLRRAESAAATAPSSKRSDRAKKSWDEMSLGERAAELYVGEKGLLFWLNKFAYASIFIVVGGWILFRFVGPSLGLYQLDAPPLPPDAIFKGGASP